MHRDPSANGQHGQQGQDGHSAQPAVGQFGYPERLVEIEVVRLVEDFSFYPRFTVDDTRVALLAERLRAGVPLDPIVADAASLRIADGFHRRRAYLRVFGETARAVARLVEFPDEAALYLATAVNARHGKPLTTGEMVRFFIRAEELGISRETVATELGVTRERLEGWVERRTAIDPSKVTRVVLKPALGHLAGGQISRTQMAVNQEAGGYRAAYYAKLLADLIESEAIDLTDGRMIDRLRRLYLLLGNLLRQIDAAAAAPTP
jgi:hypothetical protein